MSDLHLRENLSDLAKRLEELEATARKLKNQNFADIVASAKGRVQQLTEHPDLERVHDLMSGPDQPELDHAGNPLPPGRHPDAPDSVPPAGTPVMGTPPFPVGEPPAPPAPKPA